jgi:hypothetical protein
LCSQEYTLLIKRDGCWHNVSLVFLFVWWCLAPLSTEKTTDLSQVTDKLYHIMLCTSPCFFGVTISLTENFKKNDILLGGCWWFIVFNANFNNISVISWRSVLLVEETGVHWENHRPVASHWETLSHNVVWSTPRHELGLNSQL